MISQGSHALGIKELAKWDPSEDFLPHDVNFTAPKNYAESSVKRNNIKYCLAFLSQNQAPSMPQHLCTYTAVFIYLNFH